METIELQPNQIITLTDFPVHSEKVLASYYAKAKKEEDFPFVPVISKEVVKKQLDGELLKEFEEFEEENPEAQFFMLDGSHRTTALTLSGRKINVVVCDTDEQLQEAKRLIESGEILENEVLDMTVDENCEELNKHFLKNPSFMTTKEKTNKMIDEDILPQEMVVSYRNESVLKFR